MRGSARIKVLVTYRRYLLTIDHILISGRWSIASDCRVFRSAQLGNADYRFLAASLHLRPHRQHPRGTANPRPPDIEKLHTPTYDGCYAVEVANRFSALDHTEDMEDIWKQITNTLTPAAVAVLGPRRKRRQPWISDESLNLVDQCQAPEQRSLSGAQQATKT